MNPEIYYRHKVDMQNEQLRSDAHFKRWIMDKVEEFTTPLLTLLFIFTSLQALIIIILVAAFMHWIGAI